MRSITRLALLCGGSLLAACGSMRSVETQSGESPAGQTQPAETQPTETQPVETQPAETQPVETQPAETQPAETQPVETRPVETQPAETRSVETRSVDTHAAGAPPRVRASDRMTTLYVARRAWHVDVGFAAADLSAPLDSLTRRFPRAKYVFFGFGDRHYLLARSKSAPNMLAALWPGPGLILVTTIENAPAQAFGAAHVLELDLSAADSSAAQAFIRRSLPVPEDASAVPEFAPGPYEGSVYLAAGARYSALHTCNTWAAEALAAGGLPVHPRTVIFAGTLWDRARRFTIHAPLPDTRSGGE